MNNPTTYQAAGGVVVDETRTHVLVLIRPARDEIRLPKGHVEPGETLETTALREVTEETGYTDLEILAELGEQLVAFTYGGRSVMRHEHYFLMALRSRQLQERPTGDETQFFPFWASWEEARDNLTFEAERDWLRRAQQALSTHHAP